MKDKNRHSLPTSIVPLESNSQERLLFLYSYSQEMAEIGLNKAKILEIVARRAAEYLGDACLVGLVQPGGSVLHVAAVHHTDPAVHQELAKFLNGDDYDLDQGMLGQVVHQNIPIFLPQVTPDQAQLITRREYKNYIAKYGLSGMMIVPMHVKDQVVGTLGVYRGRGGAMYTEDDLSFLTQMGQRAALAVISADLYQSLQKELDEHQRTETALRQSESRFRTIYETSGLGILTLDAQGKILQANPAVEEMLGLSADELLQNSLSEIVYNPEKPKTLALFEDLMTGNTRRFNADIRLVHRDRPFVWGNCTFTLVSGADYRPHFAICMVKNITARREMEEELRESRAKLHESIELERLRLAQELHDGPMQDLHSATYQIERLKSGLSREAVESLNDIRSVLDDVISTLQSTARELRPPALRNFGVEKAIRSHAEFFQEKYPEIQIHLKLTPDAQFLPEYLRLTLFRIYQSSIMNVLRHAEASQITVRFQFDAEEAILEIEDNGKGFSVPAQRITLLRAGHYGLAGSAERAELLGGRFEVFSSPGHGTLVRAVIPRGEED